MVIYKSPDSGKTYTVTRTSCTCPHWMYKLARSGGICKHMAAGFFNSKVNKEDDGDLKMFAGGYDIDEAHEDLGDDKIQELLERQVIIQHKFKYHLCE